MFSLFVLWLFNNFHEGCFQHTVYETIIQDKYVKAISPEAYTHEPVEVYISVPLLVVVAVKEEEQLASWIAKHQYEWFDPRLVFDPKKYNTSRVVVPLESIWIPYISIYNSVETKYETDPEFRTIEISSNGSVRLIIKGYYETICQCDTGNFPYDIQVCSFDFESNMSDETLLKIRTGPALESEAFLVGTPEWSIVNQSYRHSNFFFDQRNFSTGFMDLRIKRHAQFYILTLVIPTICITLCGIAALLLPLDMTGGEKINVALASYLGLLFMMSIFITQIPKSTTFPLLGRWLLMQLFICFGALLVDPSLRFIMWLFVPKNPSKFVQSYFTRITLDCIVFLIFFVADTIVSVVMLCGNYPYVPPPGGYNIV